MDHRISVRTRTECMLAGRFRITQGTSIIACRIGTFALVFSFVSQAAVAADNGGRYSKGVSPAYPDTFETCRKDAFAVDVPRGRIMQTLRLLDKQSGCRSNIGIAGSVHADDEIGPLKGNYRYSDATRLLFQHSHWYLTKMPNGVLAVLPREVSPPGEIKKKQPRWRSLKPARVRQDNSEIEEVITTATRRRGRGSTELDVLIPSPTIVFDEHQIAAFGVSTVADLLKYLPQQPYSWGEGYRSDGAQYPAFRGLGSDTTLVLINGRPVVPSASDLGTFSAVDLNSIPLSAVADVQVMLNAPSVAYGADAIGGVVNVILKSDLSGPAVSIHYGSADEGARERRLTLQDGWSGDDWGLTAVVDFFDRTQLVGAGREFWRDQDYRRFGTRDWRSPIASPGNVRSLTADNLPGLSSRSAAVSAGATVPLQADDFIADAQNLESILKYFSVSPYTQRLSLSSTMHWKLPAGVTALGEVFHTRRSNVLQSTPPTTSGVVPASNAFNSFGVPVYVVSLLSDLAPVRVRTSMELTRIVAGLKGDIARWQWETTATRTDEQGALFRLGALDPGLLAQALSSSDRLTALNVFGPSQQHRPPLTRDLNLGALRSQGLFVRSAMTGPIWQAESSSMRANFGAEWRGQESLLATSGEDYDRRMRGLFGELLFKPQEALTFAASGRVDQYSDSGTESGHQFSVNWETVAGMTVHASLASAYRLPSVGELYGPRFEQLIPIFDPVRQEMATSVTLVSGGNPDLQAVEGRTFAAVLKFGSLYESGFEVATTYWRVTAHGRISDPQLGKLLEDGSRLGDRVQRAEPTLDDAAVNRVGALQRIDASTGNLGRLDTSGVDLAAASRFDTPIGVLAPTLGITRIQSYRVSDLPGMPQYDRVGVASPEGTIPRWRAVAQIGWTRGAFRASTTLRYVPAYDDTRDGMRTAHAVPGQLLTDVQLAIALPTAAANPFELTIGAANISNEIPHFAEVDGIYGYDLSQGDLRQRFLYLRLGKDF